MNDNQTHYIAHVTTKSPEAVGRALRAAADAGFRDIRLSAIDTAAGARRPLDAGEMERALIPAPPQAPFDERTTVIVDDPQRRLLLELLRAADAPDDLVEPLIAELADIEDELLADPADHEVDCECDDCEAARACKHCGEDHSAWGGDMTKLCAAAAAEYIRAGKLGDAMGNGSNGYGDSPA